jgi:lambda repressor-like predicted transcriptional regulator
MPKKGPAIPIPSGWKERVIARIDELGISQNELARRAKIAKSSLSAALADGSVQTTVMAQIHKVLGWDPPPTQFSPDAMELVALYEQMPEHDRGELIGRARERVRQARVSAQRGRRN